VTGEDTPLTVDVLANDGNATADQVRVVIEPEHGTASVNRDGTITYTPLADFSGPDSFGYTVGGGTHAHVTLTVVAVNDAPEVRNVTLAVSEDGTGGFALLANANDPDGDSLTISWVTQADHGVVRLRSNGYVTYRPDPDYVGVDTFSFEVCDAGGACSVGTVSVQVTVINDVILAAGPSGAGVLGPPATASRARSALDLIAASVADTARSLLLPLGALSAVTAASLVLGVGGWPVGTIRRLWWRLRRGLL
jgi:hypothetical protein